MTDIVITDITAGAVNGTGIFDKLMASVEAHIHDKKDKEVANVSKDANSTYMHTSQYEEL